MVDELSAALRALSFVALFQAAGMAMFFALFGHLLFASRAGTRRVAAGASLVALVLVVAQYALEASRMSGDFAGVVDPAMQSLVLHSSLAGAAAARVIGLMLLLVALRSNQGAGGALTALGLILVLGAFLLVGHTAKHPERWLLALLLLVHLVIVAFWFGALVPLYRASALEPAPAAGKIIEAFSAIALWFVPVLFVAGVCLALFLVKTLDGLFTTYGELLLVKVAGFAVVLGLGALNKWRLGPGVGRGDSHTLIHFRRSLAVEYVLIAAVLGVTAILTSFFSPD